MGKSTYREVCSSCKKVHDADVGRGMMNCLSCKKYVCLNCACSEGETELFIQTTGKGKIISGDPDPDMNGPCGWVCPSCFIKQFGQQPKRVSWTDNSPSSGETVVSGDLKRSVD